jgi:hypothetical protein
MVKEEEENAMIAAMYGNAFPNQSGLSGDDAMVAAAYRNSFPKEVHCAKGKCKVKAAKKGSGGGGGKAKAAAAPAVVVVPGANYKVTCFRVAGCDKKVKAGSVTMQMKKGSGYYDVLYRGEPATIRVRAANITPA